MLRDMRYEIVNPADYIQSIIKLLGDNWAETGFDFPFNPDINAYNDLYQRGFIFAVAAIEGDDVVGYCTITVTPHLHNPGVTIAASDALFVDKAYRKRSVAYRLMKKAEDEVQSRGVDKLAWHCRYGTGFADMLSKHGYERVDEVVVRSV